MAFAPWRFFKESRRLLGALAVAKLTKPPRRNHEAAFVIVDMRGLHGASEGSFRYLVRAGLDRLAAWRLTTAARLFGRDECGLGARMLVSNRKLHAVLEECLALGPARMLLTAREHEEEGSQGERAFQRKHSFVISPELLASRTHRSCPSVMRLPTQPS